MSYASLLYGMKSFYLDKLKYNGRSLDENFIDVMVDGRPPTSCPELFVSIHPGSFKGTNPEILDAIYSANVTVTFRVAKYPFDRMGRFSFLDKELGLGIFVENIINITIMNYEILKLADLFLDPNLRAQPWVEPLRLQTCSAPKLVDGNWFHSKEGVEEAIIQTISFGEARRVQFGEYQPLSVDPPVPLILDIWK